MKWDDTFGTGHGMIDGDHQRLFRLYNDFREAVGKNQAKAVVADFLAALVEYADTHFKREEALMLRHQCPDYAKHKRMHDAFASFVVTLAQKVEVQEEDVNFLLNYIEIWLLGHILIVDKWLGEYLEAGGFGEKGEH